MKRAFFVITFFLSVIIARADKDVKFYMNNGEVKCVATERVDSISFDEDADILRVTLFDRSADIQLSSVDSIAYGTLPSAVNVIYLDDRAVVENPFAFDSLEVAVAGAKVVVKCRKQQEVDYVLQGMSGDGYFKLYGLKKYNLYLNGVDLTCTTGAAINSQCGKRGRVYVVDGTVNRLTDSASYSAVAGEDEKGAFFSEGQLIFEGGNGELIVNGNYKHAICSDDYIEVRGGNIVVEKAANDAIHANDSVIVLGGSMELNAGGDGIDCDGTVRLSGGTLKITAPSDDVKGIKSAGNIIINGSDVEVNVAGSASKGIKSRGVISIESGNVNVAATGNTILLDGEPSYATCIKCDSTLSIAGGSVTLVATGIAGRGISADVDVDVMGGALNIECSGNSKIYDPTANGNVAGGEEEETNSCVLYVSIPSSTSSNRPGGGASSAWKSIYLYEGNGTLVATLTNSVVVNGTTFYYYDFGAVNSATYYLESDDYSSSRGTYTIRSAAFTGLGSDRYYQIASSYSTSGTVRTYQLNDVTSSYVGGSLSSGSSTEDSYAAAGVKCDGNFAMSGGEHLITVSGSESKGIKVEGAAVIDGGKLAINTSGTAKVVAYDPSYCTAIKCDGALTINGGNIDISATGQGGHGISVDGVLTMNGGDVGITISGAGSSYTSATGTDYYSTKCLKGDVAVNLLGGTLSCTAKGNGSKAIVAGGLLTIGKEGAADDALVVNAVTQGASLGTMSGSTGGWGGGMGGMQGGFNAAPKAIKGAADVVVNSGTIYAETACDGGEGLESKASMTINGGIVECNTYDDGINAATSLTFNGGYVYSHASNNDGIDSNGTITVNGGVVLASGTNAPEEGFDCDNNQFVINGGILVGTGSANSSVTSASQPYASVSSVTASQGKYLTVKNGSGTVLFSYKCPNTVNSATVLLSSPDFNASQHTLVHGVTSVTGASESCFGGVFLVGGTATGGSSRSFTPQSR